MITPINVNRFIRENKYKGPIQTSQIYFGKSKTFHPNGLYSEDIFGISGSQDRRNNYSWINLNCNVIHPVFFDIIKKRVERKFVPLLANEFTYNINDSGELVESDSEYGEINGMESLYKNINRLKFRKDDKPSFRNEIIGVIEKAIKDDLFFMDKLLVIPPQYRPITESQLFNEIQTDELTNIYGKVIRLAGSLSGVSGILFDVLAYRLQLLLCDLYDYIRTKIAKKEGMVRDLMLGRRVDLSARAVITPDPTLKAGEAGIPFRLACHLFEPFILYGLTNSPYAKNIPQEFYDEIRNFLKKESSVGITV